MLTQIDIQSENAFYIPVLGVTPKDSLLIKKITGLNPPQRNLFIGDYARDGGTYQGSRVGNRNIVLTIELNPNPALGETVSGLREMLYKAFMDPQVGSDHLKLLFTDDDSRELYLVGYTEKFETEIFDVETLCQLSMICPDPFIRNDTSSLLTHPSGWTQVPFTYPGTAETGFEAYIVITSPVDDLTLEVNGQTMYFSWPFETNDVVYINTSRGSREATMNLTSGLSMAAQWYDPDTTYDIGDVCLYTGGVWRKIDELDIFSTPDQSPGEWALDTQSIVGLLDPQSPWVELHSQSNVVKVYGADESDLGPVIRGFNFVPAYWGI